MTSRERVIRAIKGEATDRTPIYGWVSANLKDEINEIYGSVAAFEDLYAFDAAHIFGAPVPYKNHAYLKRIEARYDELTPDVLLEEAFFFPAADQDWSKVKEALEHHRKRERFCYMQTPGFFEFFNQVFGIENQLMYLHCITTSLPSSTPDRQIGLSDLPIAVLRLA